MYIHRLVLSLTYRCNLRCVDCCQGLDVFPQGADTDMTWRQIEGVFAFLEKQRRALTKLRICGGEPLLHLDFLRTIDEADTLLLAGKIKAVTISTNGILPRPKLPHPAMRYRVSPPPSQMTDCRNEDYRMKERHQPFRLSPREAGLETVPLPCREAARCGRVVDHRGWAFCYVAVGVSRLTGLPVHRAAPTVGIVRLQRRPSRRRSGA
jgi:hypothetical protein